MTKEEKTTLAGFLDLADGYLADGWRQDRSRDFADDPASPVLSAPAVSVVPVEQNDTLAVAAPPASSGWEAGPAGTDSLEALIADISRCEACGLCSTRTNTVPGEGVLRPLVMVIGEGPGGDEDRTGRPFVGRAGQLLDRMLDSKGRINLSRTKNCYIANVVKCRPPGNRNPQPDEISACAPFLARQIALVRPLVILAAGNVAAKALLDTTEGITKLRGKWTSLTPEVSAIGEGALRYEGAPKEIPLLPTFHPSALLRDEGLKVPVWEDLKILRTKLCELDPAYAADMANVPV
jgi:DNA polymerase